MKFAVLVHQAGPSYSAHSPDVPGVVATGDTVEETVAEYRIALMHHIWALGQVGGEMPVPEAVAAMVEIDDPA